MSMEFGGGNRTQLVRVGLQWEWEQQWWQSNGTHIGGYWDLTLSHWRAQRYRGIHGNNQNIAVLGLTPTFRFQNDSLKGFYVEGGIGAHLLSKLYDNNNRRLSTAFQFTDHLGLGYVFQNNMDIGIKVQHISNASIKSPNDGVDFAVIRLGVRF